MLFYSETRAAFGECPLCLPQQRRFEPCYSCDGTRRYLQYGCGDPCWISCPNCNESGGRDICAHGLWQWHSADPKSADPKPADPKPADPNSSPSPGRPGRNDEPAEATSQVS